MVDVITVSVSVLSSVLVSVLASIIAIEYRFRRKQSIEESQEVDEWYQEVEDRSREIQEAWERLFERPIERGGKLNISQLQGEIGTIGDRLTRLLSKSPEDISDELEGQLKTTIDLCDDLESAPVGTGVKSRLPDYGEPLVESATQLEQLAKDEGSA